MKKLRLIFISIFLLGMVFTVVQYLPILEEETPSHRLELVKKNKESCDTDGDGDTEENDNDPDPDGKADIDYYPISHFIYVLNQKHFFPSSDTGWRHRAGNVTTPPPRG